MIGVSQMMPTQPIAARESRLVSTTWPEAASTTTPCTTAMTHGQIVERNHVEVVSMLSS